MKKTKNHVDEGKYILELKEYISKLSLREIRFCIEYAATGIYTKSVEAAGFSVKCKSDKGRSLLKKTEMSEVIKILRRRYITEFLTSKDEFVYSLYCIINSDIGNLFEREVCNDQTNCKWKLKSISEIDFTGVKKLKTNSEGNNFHIVMQDKMKAFRLLAKIYELI